MLLRFLRSKLNLTLLASFAAHIILMSTGNLPANEANVGLAVANGLALLARVEDQGDKDRALGNGKGRVQVGD
jgi:hypothetical protein